MMDRTPKNTIKNEIPRKKVHMLLRIKNVKKQRLEVGCLVFGRRQSTSLMRLLFR